jgi:hypothetical protein
MLIIYVCTRDPPLCGTQHECTIHDTRVHYFCFEMVRDEVSVATHQIPITRSIY